MKVYMLVDLVCGDRFIFDNIDKAYAFALKYNEKMVETEGRWMNYGDDFHIEEITCNLDFDKWWEGEE